MLVNIKNKAFSGLKILQNENIIILLLKPFNSKTYIMIKDGIYYYISETEVLKKIRECA